MPSIRGHLALARNTMRHVIKRRELKKLYDTYRADTMVDESVFIDNLELAQLIAAQDRLDGLSVVECGTWRGGMAAGLIEILGFERAYHFFDTFAGLPAARQIDGRAALRWQADTSSPLYFNNCTASQDELCSTIRKTEINMNLVTIHKGLFEDTVSVAKTGDIAMLRLDGDWYESTIVCLRALFPRVAAQGIVIIDDYGMWDGCTRAVHDYLSATKRTEPIQRHGRCSVPYIQVGSRSN